MTADRIRTYLTEQGVQHQVHTHPTTYTTAETAEAEHVPVGQIAKVVLLNADDRLVMAVVPGDRMVDRDKAKKALGVESVRLADEGEFSARFPDCEVGAEPPFGALYGVPMVVDEGLASTQVTFNAGTHTETITLALDDYLTLTDAERANLAAGPSG